MYNHFALTSFRYLHSLDRVLPVAALQAERAGDEKPQQEAQTPVGQQEWPSEILSDTPVLCQQSGGKPGVTFTSAKGEVFSVLEWAPGKTFRCVTCDSLPLPRLLSLFYTIYPPPDLLWFYFSSVLIFTEPCSTV